MLKKVFILVFILAVAAAGAQTKKPAKGGKAKTKAPVDSAAVEENAEPVDPMEALEMTLPLEIETDPMTGKKIYYKDRKRKNDSLRNDLRMKLRKEVREFWVRTKYPPKGKTGPIQLCMNLVSKDTNLIYCTNDSIIKDPEEYKVLFKTQKGDTAYQLIYVFAYSKSRSDMGMCSGGKETKLYFTRWNTKTNKAKWKNKSVQSCLKGITLMSKESIKDWDKSEPLIVKYHRADFFYEIKFDPAKPELGFQNVKDDGGAESKEKSE